MSNFMTGFDPGKMNRRITLQPISYSDGLGIESLGDPEIVWANVFDIKASEEQILTEDYTPQIGCHIRYQSKYYTTTLRITVEGEIYNVISCRYDRDNYLLKMELVKVK